MKPTYYQILGVTENAPVQVIKAAWRVLAAENHTDRGGDPEVAAAINEAWAVLKDPKKRAAYDQGLQADRVSQMRPINRKPRAGDFIDESAYPPAYPNPVQDFWNEVLRKAGETFVDHATKNMPDEIRDTLLDKLKRRSG